MSPGIPTRLLATQSDERLLALVREGHERAFEALVQRYRRPLLSYCRRLLPEARTEDVVQLALLKTWIAVREGAEVRDLKAWLYRVVHNTAANVVRDAAHDGEPLADPADRLGSSAAGESGLDLGLTTREALAEVAALPPLQREVIVRTAVAGHSHEQVASDLGISHGAVRGLLYRARTTLRTAVTALTPPPLLSWMAGRADQGGPAPERVAELAGGGVTVGFGGLLLKGGVVALTAGTVLTGAAVVHLSGSTHHRERHGQSVVSVSGGAGVGGSSPAPAGVGLEQNESASAGSSSHRVARRSGLGHGGASGTALQTPRAGRSVAVSAPRGGGRAGTPAQPRGGSGPGAPRSEVTVQSSTPSSLGQGSPGSGSGQSGDSGQSGGSGAGQTGEPVGSAAGSGSGSGAGGSGSPPQGSGEGSGAAPGGGQSGSGSGSGSGGAEGSSGSQGASSGSESSSDSESSSGSEPSGGSSGEQSGSLVGTVVHEVGNVLEHLLH